MSDIFSPSYPRKVLVDGGALQEDLERLRARIVELEREKEVACTQTKQWRNAVVRKVKRIVDLKVQLDAQDLNYGIVISLLRKQVEELQAKLAEAQTLERIPT